MAKGRKSGPSRLDLRRQAEAAEAREPEEVEDDEDETEEDEEESEEDEEEEAVADDEGGDDDGGDDDDEDAPKKKKKKEKKAKVVAAKPKRTRVAKIVTMRAVWVVFDNSSKVLEKFPFNQKEAAEEFLAKKQEEKKGTCYIQLVKEEMK